MNLHNQPKDILDLSLHRLLKNWVGRKPVPVQGRNQLLAIAAQQEILPESTKLPKQKLRWLYYSQGTHTESSAFSVHGHALDTVCALKANMTIA